MAICFKKYVLCKVNKRRHLAVKLLTEAYPHT